LFFFYFIIEVTFWTSSNIFFYWHFCMKKNKGWRELTLLRCGMRLLRPYAVLSKMSLGARGFLENLLRTFVL
jgi:hypothetical protein